MKCSLEAALSFSSWPVHFARNSAGVMWAVFGEGASCTCEQLSRRRFRGSADALVRWPGLRWPRGRACRRDVGRRLTACHHAGDGTRAHTETAPQHHARDAHATTATAEHNGVAAEAAPTVGWTPGEGNLVGLLDLVDEVRVDDNAVGVADDEQRRVLQRLAILEELLVGRVEVGVEALVLPVDGRDE